MYACESIWFQKEERRKTLYKTIGNYAGIGFLILLILAFVFFLIGGFFSKVPENHTLLQEETINQTMNNAENIKNTLPSDNKTSENGSGELMEDVIYEDLYLEEEESDIPLIIIDPGHGGMDEGCSRAGVEEKVYNLELALLLKEKLEGLGFRVLLTRTEDIEISLVERTEFTIASKGDMLISIHQNASEYSSAEGIETWFYEEGEGENKKLASLVQNYVTMYTDAKNRGIQETDGLYVIRECKIPACLIETGFLSNMSDLEKIQSEEYREKIVQGLTDAVWYYYNPKKMYLTFDDGPSKENTARILDVLKEKNIQATFFVVGENVEKYPELIQRMAQEGHTIGVHCYSHSYDDIYCSVDGFVADFEKAKAAVQKIVDVEIWCYRFPGGSINSHNKEIYKDIIEKMSEMGYVYFDWNASMEDAVKKTTTEQIMQNAVESTLQRKKVVMLGHDIVYNTSICLEDLLDCFPEYEFLPLTKDVIPIQFKQ